MSVASEEVQRNIAAPPVHAVAAGLGAGATYFILFLVGAALSIAQFVMIRDFVSILYGEEVVIVMVTASFFLGLSAGYLLANKLSLKAFRFLFIFSVFIHLTFPFSYRWIASWLAWSNAGGIAYLSLLFFYALVFNTMFATFLPRLVHTDAAERLTPLQRLQRYYGLELAGFITGFAIIIFSWNRPLEYLLAPYWLIIGLVLFFVARSKLLLAAYAVLAVSAVMFLPLLDRQSTALLYMFKHGINLPKVLYSVNSPYQRVEVIEDTRGTRYLYLDGLQNLNSTDLAELNYFIAEVPAILIKPEKTLLIGNGTLSSVRRVYPHSGSVVSVELDGGVLEAGRRHFTSPESLAGFTNWRLLVDDGKHFLRDNDERYDLIIVDVPSPLTIQEAYLHSKEFYALCNEHLTERGVLAVQLSGPLELNDRTPARVAAALRAVFPEVMALDSREADRGFAYASRKLPFTEAQMREQVKNDGQVNIIAPERIDTYLTRAVPLSVNSMDLVLRRGWERFVRRYF